MEGISDFFIRRRKNVFDGIDAVEGFEILSLQAQMVAVYNLQGEVLMHQYMAEGEQVRVAAPAGLYVVKGEKEAIKIMVDWWFQAKKSKI